MTESVCFRCDWRGRARAHACPSCGAPLYRQTRAGSEPGIGLPEDDDARLGEDPTRRAVPRGLAIAIAVALAIVAVASIEQRFGDAAPVRPVASNPEVGSGALVYLAPTRGNLQLTLERWPDLAFRGTREHLAAAA